MRPASARTRLRARALDLLVIGERLNPRIQAGLRRPRVHMLYSHSLAAADVDNFRALVTWLAGRYKLVGYDEATRRIRSGGFDETAVAFSFDDGFRSCLRAADILAEFGVTAGFFICPSMLGVNDPQQISAAFGIGDANETMMTWGDVERLKGDGHEIGSHTMHHANLAAVSRDCADEEIGQSFETLRYRLGGVRHFAWPYGTLRHFSASSAQTVFSTGYETCASALRGCHVAPVAERTQLCIRREHVQFDWPIDHVRHFLARSGSRASAAMNRWPDGWCTGDASEHTQGAFHVS